MSRWADTIRRWAAGIALVAIVVGGIGIGTFVLFSGDEPADTSAAPRSMPPPAPKPVPAPNEFTVGVTVTAQDCAPPGDCVYTYTIEPRYIGLRGLPERELRVSYRVNGGRQPQDGSFTVDGRQARFLKDVTIEAPAGARLSAAVVGVAETPVHGPTVVR